MALRRARVAVLLTGVASATRWCRRSPSTPAIAADPNPLAPAQYAAHHRRAVPRFDDPAYVPALQELCEEFGVGAVVPLTDLDLEILGRARAEGGFRRSSPTPRRGARTFDKYETHLLLQRLGLPSPPTVLPGEPVGATR